MANFIDKRLDANYFGSIFTQLLETPGVRFFEEVFTSNMPNNMEQLDFYEINQKTAKEYIESGEFAYNTRSAFVAPKCIRTTSYANPVIIKLDGEVWGHNEIVIFRTFKQFDDGIWEEPQAYPCTLDELKKQIANRK